MHCKECRSDRFTVNSGFYYCDNCGMRTEQLRELEYDTYFDHINNQLIRTNLNKTATTKKEEDRITTWEEYNYILLGLVNQLISLGAKDELKLTTVQLWTTYLRRNEVAFFSRKEPKVPKLGASFKKKDAAIIYNLKVEKRANKKARSATGSADGRSIMSGTSGFSRRSYKRKQKDLASAEYDMLMSERDTNASMSVMSRSMISGETGSSSNGSSSSSWRSVRIEFSRMSRRILKKKIAKKHLRKHELDGLLECHSFNRQNNKRQHYPDIVSRSLLYEILYLALNHIQDQIQMGDMIRYIREGHLAYTNVQRFLPENVQSLKPEHNFNLSPSVAPSHVFLRSSCDHMRRLLSVRLTLPNFEQLSKRYVDELCLPIEVLMIVKNILLVCPPEMNVQECAKVRMPNYEGRAVALVLFAVKLIFGLDDERERRMSESASNINEHLKEYGDNHQPLFVWTEWMKYIEMRNVILAQCHYSTSNCVDPESRDNSHLYLEFLRMHDFEEEANSKKRAEDLINMELIFNKAKHLHEDETKKSSLDFQPSLTPKRSYMECLLADTVMSTNLYIPPFMKVDHTEFDCLSYLRPGLLRKYMKNIGTNVRIERLECNKRVVFDRLFTKYFPETTPPYADGIKLFSYQYDIGNNDWEEEVKLTTKEKEKRARHDKYNQEILVRRNLALSKEHNRQVYEKRKQESQGITTNAVQNDSFEQLQSKDHQPDDDVNSPLNVSIEIFSQESQVDSIPAAQKTSKVIDVSTSPKDLTEEPNDLPLDDADDIPDEALQCPRRLVDDVIPLFDCIHSDDEEDEDDATTTTDDNNAENIPVFHVNSFEHWICMGHMHDMSTEHFENVRKRLPLSFQWMLRECAQMVQCKERDVYRELLVIENQFTYVIAPFGEMRNMLLFQTPKEYSHVKGYFQQATRNLRRYW